METECDSFQRKTQRKIELRQYLLKDKEMI